MPYLFPSDDPVMLLRMKRQVVGLASYLMFVLPLTFAVWHQWTGFGYLGLAVFVALSVLANIAFALLIRSRWSEKYEDPSMTLHQLVVAVLMALAMVYYAGEAQGVLLMLFFTIFFFGVFALNTRQFLGLTVFTAVGYAGVLLVKFDLRPISKDQLDLEILRYLVLVVILIWLSFIGGHVAQLRAKLASQKKKLTAALERVQSLLRHDELTGVFNRRYLMEILAVEKDRFERYGGVGFSVCLLDLDRFKAVNDTHGHQVGDEVLQEFASIMKAHARGPDVVGRTERDVSCGRTTFGRYGGEEFLLMLPNTPKEGALVCIERMRNAIAKTNIKTSVGMLHLTFSAGVAHHRAGESLAETIARADSGLYLAKSRGRNRTELSD